MANGGDHANLMILAANANLHLFKMSFYRSVLAEPAGAAVEIERILIPGSEQSKARLPNARFRSTVPEGQG
jgi:hypothetical protein